MKCCKCEQEKPVVHRTAPKGQTPANWTCWDCLTPDQKKAIDPGTKAFTNDLSKLLNEIK